MHMSAPLKHRDFSPMRQGRLRSVQVDNGLSIGGRQEGIREVGVVCRRIIAVGLAAARENLVETAHSDAFIDSA